MSKNKIIDDEIGKKVFKQTLDLWVLPEVQKRQNSGDLPKPINLYAAQVIFYPDERKPLVRINDGIKAFGKVKFKKGLNVKVGDPIYESQIERLENFKLTDDDPGDCGHITMKRIKNSWTLVFDFRCNRELSQKHIDKAIEFYKTAKYAFKKGYFSTFIDNLFSASELTIKAMLLIGPYKMLRKKSSHKSIKILLNKNVKLKNIKKDYKDLLDKLSRLRDSERYLKDGPKLNEMNSQRMLKTIEEMIEFAKSCIRVE